ncbi:hypothetical protein T484DRAFT_1805189 [Baffinella frigidus]|nr:hypothetical protein T484DRAFT_1805189 [Cryptophyta sp. CCMP2293]
MGASPESNAALAAGAFVALAFGSMAWLSAEAVLFLFLGLLLGDLALGRGDSADTPGEGAGHASSRSKEEAEEAAFRRAYPGYGYDGELAEVLEDFAHLPRDEVYLDHAGATLPAASQARS